MIKYINCFIKVDSCRTVFFNFSSFAGKIGSRSKLLKDNMELKEFSKVSMQKDINLTVKGCTDLVTCPIFC